MAEAVQPFSQTHPDLERKSLMPRPSRREPLDERLHDDPFRGLVELPNFGHVASGTGLDETLLLLRISATSGDHPAAPSIGRR